jgi:hypothetical protein
MMNDSLNEYQLTSNFEYRRQALMDEARRERLKASVLRRARQSQRPGRLTLVIAHLSAMWRTRLLELQGSPPINPSGAIDDCLESSLT